MRPLDRRWATTLAVFAACATAPPPSRPAPDRAASLEEGPCGGLEAEPLAYEHSLLEGRLRVSLPAEGTVRVSSAPSRGMAPTPRAETVLDVGSTLRLRTRELFARAGEGGLAAAAERDLGPHPEAYDVRQPAGGLPSTVVALARRPERVDGRLQIAVMFGETPDGLVQKTVLSVAGEERNAPGCGLLALRIAASMRPGPRTLQRPSGRVALRPDLTVDLPEDWAIVPVTLDRARGTVRYDLHPLGEVGEPEGHLSVVVQPPGPSVYRPPPGLEAGPSTLFGRPATWSERVQHGYRIREGWSAPIAAGSVAVSIGAERDRDLELRATVARSLSMSEVPDPLFACEGRRPRSPEPYAALENAVLDGPGSDGASEPGEADPAIPRLSRADSFAAVSMTFGSEPLEAASLRRLAARADAVAVFEHLVATGTVAGKLYGLAGLAWTDDPERFRDIFCTVAPTLAGEVAVVTRCGAATAPVEALLESPQAAEDPGFWRLEEWIRSPGTRDVRGGGLAFELFAGPVADSALSDAVAQLARSEADEPVFEPSRPSAPPTLDANRLCAARSDGRWACWNATRSWLGSSAIRRPRAVSGGASWCAEDERGRLRCTGADLARAVAVERAACGGPAEEVPVRAVEGEGWRLTGIHPEVCAIGAGALHCSVDGGAFAPALRGAAPLVGAVRGHGALRWAWDEAGTVYRWRVVGARIGRPEALARLEGLASLAAGTRLTFARMRDGRVLALGPQPGEPWWDLVGPLGQEWVELPEFHGAQSLTLGQEHGCARFDRGVVRCWGKSADGELGEGASGRAAGPTEVRALRGARTLLLGPSVSCGLLPGDRLRCVGSGAARYGTPGRGGLDLRLGRRASAVTETTSGPGTPSAAEGDD